MITKWAGLLAAAFLTLAGLAVPSRAQDAPAPAGLYAGQFPDGAAASLYLQPGGGWAGDVGGVMAGGDRWDWSPSSTGGILTLHYFHGGEERSLYYNITYLGSDRILMSDPYFNITLQRQ